jgi:mRNA-degrading endonuclease toxin of MazEF toxin-antitoxin module
MAKATKVILPQRGEVYLVSLDPTVGAEIKKTRPAVVVQNDPANRRAPSSSSRPSPRNSRSRSTLRRSWYEPRTGGLRPTLWCS